MKLYFAQMAFFITFAQIITSAMKIIGRDKEIKILEDHLNSDKSEFIAVYGRRRVGKTFLIRMAAKDDFAFFITGIHDAPMSEQLTNFAVALQRYSKAERLSVPKNWILAFFELSKYLETLPEGAKTIFIDELPWMDTPRSGFIAALENFWNGWASLRSDIKLIVCGSATSWIINNLIRNRGGLHNRLTYHLSLAPFNLHECGEYFASNGFSYTRKQIAECYMAVGGIPYYLSMMDRSLSLAQNIDRLFFADDALLKDEFYDLYHALFKNAAPHTAVVTALASKGIGMTRGELLQATGLTDNGAFSTVLEELEQCGFIRSYEPFGKPRNVNNKRQKTNTVFQLMDFYTLFYYRFILSNRYRDTHFWTNSLNSPLHGTWSGLAFEMLCLFHLPQIKHALGISGVLTLACSWRGSAGEKGAQIDLLIDRKDDTINLCEIKYVNDVFEIDKDYASALENKINVFVSGTQTRKSVILTLISTFGIKQNKYSDLVQCEVLLDDLFHKI